MNSDFISAPPDQYFSMMFGFAMSAKVIEHSPLPSLPSPMVLPLENLPTNFSDEQ